MNFIITVEIDILKSSDVETLIMQLDIEVHRAMDMLPNYVHA